MPFGWNLKIRRRGRSKQKDPTCLESLDSAMEILNLEHGDSVKPYCNHIKSGLEYIQAFLRFAQKNESGAPEDLVSSIEDAFKSAGLDIKNAIKNSSALSSYVMRELSIALERKVGLFRARIHEAYGNSKLIQGSFTPGIGPYARVEKNDAYSTCLDYAIETITERYRLNDMLTWRQVEEELKMIQIVLIFVPRWSDVGKFIGENPGDLIGCIENAFSTVEVDIENAIKKGDDEGLDVLHSNLLEKIEILKPRITEAFASLSEDKLFQNTKPLVLAIKPNFWGLFFDLLLLGGQKLNRWFSTGYLFEEFSEIAKAVQYFGNVYIDCTSKGDGTHDLWEIGSLMNDGAVYLARVLFLLRGDEMNGGDFIEAISDLWQRIRLKFPKICVMYMQPLRDLKNEDVNQLVDIILPRQKIPLRALRDGLHPLIDDLINSCSMTLLEEVKLLRLDIRKVVCDDILAIDDDDWRLVNMDYLNVEVVMRMLMSMSEYSISTGVVLEVINMGQSIVQTLVNQGVLTEMATLILKRMEQVVNELTSLQSCTGRHFEALKFKLCIKFKITKIQAFLMDRCTPSLMLILEDKVHTLGEGLQLLFKYLSLLPDKNQGHEDLIVTCFENVAKERLLPYDFSRLNQDHQLIINQMSNIISNMVQRVNHINSLTQDIIVTCQSLLVPTLPKMHQGLAFIVSFLEKMRGLVIHEVDLIENSIKCQIEIVIKELESFRSFLLMRRVGEKYYQNPDLQGQIIMAAHEADYIIDWILLGKLDWKHMLWLSIVINNMKELNGKLTDFVQVESDSSVVHFSEQQPITIQASRGFEVDEIVISLKDQEEIIIDQLTRGTSQKRNVVTIFGMPGIGKTTLAKKVYDHPRVKTHFYKLAWCCISQVYRKRELLLKILCDITKSSNDEVDKKSDDELMDMLYKGLKGARYCIVMDDVWSNQVWEECGIVFPDDKNGSRIIITTRNQDVAQPHGVPHTLRSLTKDESWKLLRQKVFHEDMCPPELEEIGLMIAGGCKGLPLSIVAIAGILKTKKDADWWKQIERDLNSRIFDNPEIQCMHILELSYNHLPDNLKPCFLYFAAFGEDSEVPVKKLIWFWIAEGFVIETRDKAASLEDVAEIYVMNLIARSLLMVVKRGSDGRVKACKVHDMLYKVCLRKVEEDNFLQYVNGYDELFPSNDRQLDYGVEDAEYSPVSVVYNQRRLSLCSKRKHFVMLKPSGPSVRTLLFKATRDTFPRCPYDDVAFILENFKILSILDIESINIGSSFPKRIEFLYPLRYLGICGDIRYVPSTIAKLWNLETLVVKGLMGKVTLPDSLWNMSKLRHLHVTTQAIFSLPDVKDDEITPELHNMVSLSCPALSQGDHYEEVMKRFPKLRKLRCTFSEPAQRSKGSLRFPALEFLVELESLKIIYYGHLHQYCQLKGVRFPQNIKKLSLSDFSFTWDDFLVIGKLPNLNILKLVSIAFDSQKWEMSDDEFRQLEYLKLDSLKITEWNVESDPVPNIKQLVLTNCIRLKEVPASFGDIPTLEVIEMKWCSSSAEDSVMAILEQKLEYGDDGFKAFINGFVADPKFSMDD